MLAPVQFEARIGDHGEVVPTGSLARRVVGRLQALRGRAALVTIEPERKRRSLKANALLWLHYQAIADWSGHSKEEIHEAMKRKFLPARAMIFPTGEEVDGFTTTKLDPGEFSHFISDVRGWMLESRCPVPDLEG
jgi:hypothetical protein